jgi:hypothetical protein
MAFGFSWINLLSKHTRSYLIIPSATIYENTGLGWPKEKGG